MKCRLQTSILTLPENESPTPEHSSQRGVALLVALMLIVVLSLLAFALVTRSFVASRVAGIERFKTMTFYAADNGINCMQTRLSHGEFGEFALDVPAEAGRPIKVVVSPLLLAGPPRAVVGSQIGGGQGSDGDSFCVLVYRGDSHALHSPTGSQTAVSATLSLGPIPLSSIVSGDVNLAGGGEK